MTTIDDALGMLLAAELERPGAVEVEERDDGFVEVLPVGYYFSSYRRWPARQRQAMRYVRGRVLDVGCGAGRVALHLQERGHEVVAIDVSPGAIEVCRRRGVRDARVMGLGEVRASRGLGVFDTVALLGNSFGVFENQKRAPVLLRQLRGVCTERGRVIAETFDPHLTDDPSHLAYARRNRKRGRMAGQVRMRVRYREYATPWFDWLFVSREELRDLAARGGWRVARFLPEEVIPEEGPVYIAILEPAD